MSILLNLILKVRRLYWRIVKPKTIGVRAILVNQQGEICLVKHGYGDGWFLPGGKARNNELVEDALRRELKEELGVQSLLIDRTLGVYTNLQEYKTDTITVYVVKEFSQTKKKHFEIKAEGFFSPSNLPEGTSPGTRRRIAEYLGQQSSTTVW